MVRGALGGMGIDALVKASFLTNATFCRPVHCKSADAARAAANVHISPQGLPWWFRT